MKSIDEIHAAISVCDNVIEKQNQIIDNPKNELNIILNANDVRSRFLIRKRIFEWIMTDDYTNSWI
jgi:hypothetical protein